MSDIIIPVEQIITLKKNIVEKNINHEFCAKNTDGTRIYFNEEINKNDLISKKCKKICTA